MRYYAVVWDGPEGERSGRLEVLPDRFELSGGKERVAVRFADLVSVSIGRRPGDRLRGLPVLRLRERDGRERRVASLQGTSILHELSRHAGGAAG